MGGELRVGECGQAEPLNFWDKWLNPFWTERVRRPIKDGQQPVSPFFRGEDPEGWDELVLKMHQKRYEANPSHNEKYPDDNTTMTHMRERHRLQRTNVWPEFTDFIRTEYKPGYDVMKYSMYLQRQYVHCVGNLGEDHPTCQKAGWYRHIGTPPTAASWFEEVTELGHFDMGLKWGFKDNVSFLPMYQPVKKNIPGAYEFYRSKTYLEKYDVEGNGEWAYPFIFVE
eukprot:TRINITY_DN767_c0_g3_i1.p2 TRINITY_DN767_c0_g3~~TRINITY_DN767_c0_g3_i1.p2  ORF type:complete len:226 (+),score=74.84 TRINITY_DN767_c0_g3_i1:79-756(+)